MVMTRWLGGGRREARTANLAGFGITPPWQGSFGQSAVAVTPTTVAGIPAFTQAVRIAASEVAQLELRVYRGDGFDRTRVTSTWQARFFAGQPNDQQDSFQWKEAIEESLSFRGNAYIWKNIDPRTGRVVELYALHPDQVGPLRVGSEKKYIVGVMPGYVDPVGKGNGFYTVDASTILHVKGFGDGGAWIAPSPIEKHRAALGATLGKYAHENSLYANRAHMPFIITYPAGMTRDQAETWRTMWQETYGGAQNAGKTGVLGGGADVKPIGLSQADAQFVESQQWSVEDIARIANMTSSVIGGGATSGGRAQAPLTPEHEQARLLRYHIGPRLVRIESAMRADADLFGPSTRDYPQFDAGEFIRGDLATEAAIAATKVQTGQWLVDEARARDGLPPLPNGAGQIPQVIPVGGGANPNPAPAAPATPAPAEPSTPPKE